MSARVPAHALIPAICEAVKRGNVQRGTIRHALHAAGFEIGDSTLSNVLRLAVAQGFLFRAGDKRGARYEICNWRRRRDRELEKQGPAPFLETLTFEDL